MAISNYIGDRIVGLSTDLDTTNATNGSFFIASDTLKVYLREAGNWEEIDVSQSISTLDDVVLGSVATGDFLRFDGDDWVNTTLVAGDIPNLDAAKITTGTFADARISQTSVTQHEAALSITESQITDLGNYLESVAFNDLTDVTLTSPTTDQVVAYDGAEWVNVDLSTIISDVSSLDDLSDVNISTAAAGDFLRHNGTNWVDATIQDSDINETAVTQHEAALSITESQITDLGNYLESVALNDVTDVTITTPTTGNTLFYDGAGWVNRDITESDISDLGNYLESVALPDLTDVTITSADTGDFIRYNGSVWVDAQLTSGDIPDISGTYQVTSEKNAANGYVGLDANTKVPSQYLPALAITEVFVVADITARDALTIGTGDGEVQEGDVAVVTDASGDPNVDSGSASYIYDGSGWQQLETPDITAGGTNTQVQYNSNGDFAGSANFTFDGNVLSLTGHMELSENAMAVPTLASGDARFYTETGTEGADNYTRTMLRIGDTDYIVASHIE